MKCNSNKSCLSAFKAAKSFPFIVRFKNKKLKILKHYEFDKEAILAENVLKSSSVVVLEIV